MGNRYVGSGRHSEGGFFATHKQDFLAHTGGTDFRHNATMEDMNPVLTGFTSTTVQSTFEEMHTLITSSGTGFISIGSVAFDGYGRGSYNVGSIATPLFSDALTAALADHRVAGGGIIFILAGTYHLGITITIPAGICLMGELSGTTIVGETTEQPLFLINNAAPITIGGDSGGGPVAINAGSNIKQVRFFNLTIIDNLNSNVAGGNSSMSSVPMVRCKNASNFSCDHVSFIGKLNSGTIVNRTKTFAAIGYTSGGGTGTTLSVNDCFFDGLRTGILFSPGNGSIDSLSVSRCRARIYGTENLSNAGAAVNSFIVSTLCNAVVTNNYHLGAGTTANYFMTFTTSSGVDSKIVITGNSGGPNDNTTATPGLLINGSGQTLTTIMTGNNWGSVIDSSWFLVVGSPDGNYPHGDISGPNAIDIVINLANANNLQTTVIVNPGTYTVTAGNKLNNLKFIGNKRGKKLPVFNLNSSDVTTDGLGNKFLSVGNYLQSLYFTSVGSTHSVAPSFSSAETTFNGIIPSNLLEVKDCVFNNACLFPKDPGNLPWTDQLGNTADIKLKVTDCRFLQTGAFPDSVSAALPNCNFLTVDGCNFIGNGYALSVGVGYSAQVFPSQCVVSNCVIDKTGGTVTIFSPFGATKSSILCIEHATARVAVQNCKILADSALSNSSVIIDSSLLTDASFGIYSSFSRITAKDILIDNCVINGPGNAPYTKGGATNYALPAMMLEPIRMGRVTNCQFLEGMLPLKFGGSTIFSDTTNKGEIIVSNSIFNTDGVTAAQTALDVDLNLSVGPHNILITNNQFACASGSPTTVEHTNATSSIYLATGCVQVYAGRCYVTITENNINSTLYALTGFNTLAALVVNNYDTVSSAGTLVNPVNISENIIVCNNNFSTANAAQSSSDIYVRSTGIKLTDNLIQMNNNAGTSASFLGCIAVDLHSTNGVYGTGIISNNIISRRDISANATNLNRGYIQILSGDVRGTITENSFSDITIDGSSVVQIEDNNTEPKKWTVTRNKNQTETALIKGFVGLIANDAAAGGLTILGTYPTNLIVKVFDLDPPSYTIEGDYVSGTAKFYWRLALFEILPPNVTIDSVTVTAASSAHLDNGTFVFKLIGNGLTTVNGSPVIDLTSTNLQLSSITTLNNANITTYKNTAILNLHLELSCANISSGSAKTINFTGFTFTYHW